MAATTSSYTGDDLMLNPIDNLTSATLDRPHDPNYGLAAAEIVITILGLVFNLVVILLICVLKDYKKTSHWYVLHLAIADGIFLLSLPFGTAQRIRGVWDFGHEFCFVYQAARHIGYYVSILLLTVMSFDRYVAIVHPMSTIWRTFRSTKGSLVVTAAVWLIAGGLTTPILMKTHSRPTCHYPKIDQRCIDGEIPQNACDWYLQVEISNPDYEDYAEMEDSTSTYNDDYNEEDYEDYSGMEDSTSVPLYHHSYVAWLIGDFVVVFVFPVVCMVICYGCILWRMQHPRVQSTRTSSFKLGRKPSSSSASSGTGRGKDIKVMILVISLVVAFIACWLPYNTMILYDALHKTVDRRTMTALRLLAFSNTLMNPILYTFLGINFMRRLRTAFARAMPDRDAREIASSFKYVKNRERLVGSLTTKTTKGTDSSDVHSGGSANIQMQVLVQVHPKKEDQNKNVYTPCPGKETTDDQQEILS